MAENENGVEENADVTAVATADVTPETTSSTDDVSASQTDSDSDSASTEGETGGAFSAGDAPETFSNTPAPTTSREFAAQGELVDALSASSDENEGEAREVEGGRSYEMVYISRVGDGEATESTTKRLRELIEGASGAIDNVRNSETRRLAYPIGGEIEGVYIVVNGRFAPEHIGEVDRFFKLEENVIRHMILRQED